jgi:IclR family pca regulon transcriptional regulator
MHVTVHAAETTTEEVLREHLPLLLRTAGDVGADRALGQSQPHGSVDRPVADGSAAA